jgi:ABC-type nitrate/sulfonate/bicarbonate transport system permease component
MNVARRRTWRLTPAATRLLIVVGLLIVWEIAARGFVSPRFLAPPSRVIPSLGALLTAPGVANALAVTLGELAAAFVLSTIIGLVLGLLVGLHRPTLRAAMPIVLLLYATPQVTILPLFILYFGIGAASKIAFGVSHGMFPVLVTVVAGVQNVKPVLLRAAQSMGASPRQVFRWVIFPHMMPSFFAGLRLAMTAVLLGVLLAELYVSQAGIGYFVRRFTQAVDPTNLFGLVMVVAAIAIALNEAVRRAEIRFSRWQSE